MENANIIRKIIREQLRKINEMSWESGYYPPGAEHDSSAPWNEEPSPEIEFTADYDNQKFYVTVDNGNSYEVDFIDVLDRYWKNHEKEQAFEKHNAMFPDDEQIDVKLIQMLLANTTTYNEIDNILYDLGGDNLYDD